MAIVVAEPIATLEADTPDALAMESSVILALAVIDS